MQIHSCLFFCGISLTSNIIAGSADLLPTFGNGYLSTTTAAEQTVTGTVSDEKDEVLPGVSVVVKGTQRGTTANAKGPYRIRYPTDQLR
ncbi:carboxypeptidase-like regulatory domain-containing protein [Spirosoma taeanense]|uniref:carboxypeptidase-like regulatory domain-containing protein n=1 Tax=Spirosoma taeanense TaxID=2735870 RepID=UPI00293BE791|nr:carboxypeptidase-like regulatory domain-containing protein [Spirosoma taeanense]